MSTPSPFEVGRSIAGAGFGALNERRDQNSIQDILAQTAESEDPAELQNAIGKILSSVSKENQPRAIAFIQDQMKGIETKKARAQNFESKTKIANINAQARKEVAQINAKAKEKDKKIEDKEQKKVTRDVFDRLVELVPKVGFKKQIVAKFGGETARDFGEFNSLLGTLEAEMVKRVSRGNLSNTRFNFIINQLLPTPEDTQETINGKLKGIKQMLNLDDKIEVTNADGKVGYMTQENIDRAGAKNVIYTPVQ